MYPPGGYPPGGYPGGAPGSPPAPAPATRVEVKVSYGARVGCALAIGIVIMLLSIVALVAYFVNATDAGSGDSTTKNAIAPCGDKDPSAYRTLSGPKTCADVGEHNYFWTAVEAGTYTITSTSTGPTARAQC